MGPTSKDLLDMEHKCHNSPLETRLLLSNNNATNVSHTKGDNDKFRTTTVPASTVLGKLKDFLPVMDEANRKLNIEIQEKHVKNYDIEVLTGEEEQYIEMDLALGVAELHSAEALAAAELAMVGQGQTLSLSAISEDSDSSCDTEDDGGGDNNGSNHSDCSVQSENSKRERSICRKGKKRPKIEFLK
eukprot:Gb_36095 [translate_table: standard]